MRSRKARLIATISASCGAPRAARAMLVDIQRGSSPGGPTMAIRSIRPVPLPRIPAGLALALLLSSCAAAAAPATPAGDQDGPRQLVARLAELEEEERYGEVLALIRPDQREAYVFLSWYGAAFDAIGAEPEVVDDYRAIVSAHGLDEAWLSEDASGRGGLRRVAGKALRGVDLPALLDDLARFREQHGRFGTAFGFTGTLDELHVEGDRAQARVGDTELELSRTEGLWTWCPLPGLDRQGRAEPQ